MKKVLLSLAAVTAIAAATPAAAGHNDRDGRNHAAQRLNQREAQLAQRIDRAVHTGKITRAEAVMLRRQLARIEILERHYRRGGLSRAEIHDLNVRLDRLQVVVLQARLDDDRRYGYGYRW